MTESPKRLQSATIIDDALYVDRDADRQLNSIIDEMGRPGYILVARQMGKTNLLLRMKRRREKEGDLVLYFDLSSRFETSRELFRHIIDGLIERTNSNEVRESIELSRMTTSLDSNSEFDRHIRQVIAATDYNKVIIILDEIDSLVGREYSDRILAQIRSMYFARANYPVYDRLTYVLSGVAEPTDLIKDKNISPFNIGEKIYLSDFSIAEVDQLCRKARLNLPPDIVEAVYVWASGNPRMTWDILSALEDAQRANEELSIANVNAIVTRLYLTRYDRPPIDHIRALAETDPDVRRSLISLLNGKGHTLDDAARSRLYLSGITGASTNEAPKIKNPIIQSALSESWLTQVEAKSEGMANTASRFYREAKYDQAIALYNELIIAEGGSDFLSDLQHFELAMAYYKTSLLYDAESFFNMALRKTRSKDLSNTIKFYQASLKLRSKQADEAIALFKEVIAYNGNFRIQAKHAITSVYLLKSITDYGEDIITECKGVIADVDADIELTGSEIAGLKAASFYNMSQVYAATGKARLAHDAVMSAIGIIDDERYAGLAAIILRTVSDLEKRREILSRATHYVVNIKPPIEISTGGFEFTSESLVRLIDVSVELDDKLSYDQLFNFALEYGEGSRFDRAYNLVSGQMRSARTLDWCNAVLKSAFDRTDVISTSSARSRLSAARLWLEVSSDPDNSIAFKYFLDELYSEPSSIIEHDLILIINRFSLILRSGPEAGGWDIIDFVARNESFFRSRVKVIFTIYMQHKMAFFRSLNDMDQEKAAAREIIKLTNLSSIKGTDLSEKSQSLMMQLRVRAQDALRAPAGPVLSTLRRNDVVIVRDVQTGLESIVKYKKVTERLRNGEVQFVRRLDSKA